MYEIVTMSWRTEKHINFLLFSNGKYYFPPKNVQKVSKTCPKKCPKSVQNVSKTMSNKCPNALVTGVWNFHNYSQTQNDKTSNNIYIYNINLFNLVDLNNLLAFYPVMTKLVIFVPPTTIFSCRPNFGRLLTHSLFSFPCCFNYEALNSRKHFEMR